MSDNMRNNSSSFKKLILTALLLGCGVVFSGNIPVELQVCDHWQAMATEEGTGFSRKQCENILTHVQSKCGNYDEILSCMLRASTVDGLSSCIDSCKE